MDENQDISAEKLLKARTTAMRHKLKLDDYHGNFEEILYNIEYMNTILGRAKAFPPEFDHAHKAELSHSAEPSLSLSERLAANPSFRNAAHT